MAVSWSEAGGGQDHSEAALYSTHSPSEPPTRGPVGVCGEANWMGRGAEATEGMAGPVPHQGASFLTGTPHRSPQPQPHPHAWPGTNGPRPQPRAPARFALS